MADATLREVIARMKAEGQLTRNTGTNSIKVLNTNLQDIKNVLSDRFQTMANSIDEMTTSTQESIVASEDLKTETPTPVVVEPDTTSAKEVEKERKQNRIFSKMLGTLTGISKGLGGFLGKFGKFLGDKAKAVGGGIFSFLKKLGLGALLYGLYEFFNSEYFTKTLNYLKEEVWPKVVYFYDNILVPIGNTIKAIFLDQMPIIGALFDDIGLAIDQFRNGEWIEGSITIIEGIGAFIRDTFDNFGTKIYNQFAEWLGFEKIDSLFKDVFFFRELERTIQEIWSSFKTILGGDYSAENLLQGGLALFDLVTLPVNAAINAVGEIFGWNPDDAWTGSDGKFKLSLFIKDQVTSLVNWFKEFFSLESFRNLALSVVEGIPGASKFVDWLLGKEAKTKTETIDAEQSRFKDEMSELDRRLMEKQQAVDNARTDASRKIAEQNLENYKRTDAILRKKAEEKHKKEMERLDSLSAQDEEFMGKRGVLEKATMSGMSEEYKALNSERMRVQQELNMMNDELALNYSDDLARDAEKKKERLREIEKQQSDMAAKERQATNAVQAERLRQDAIRRGEPVYDDFGNLVVPARNLQRGVDGSTPSSNNVDRERQLRDENIELKSQVQQPNAIVVEQTTNNVNSGSKNLLVTGNILDTDFETRSLVSAGSY